MSLANLVNFAADVYFWILFIAIALTWIPHDPYHPAIRFFRRASEPVLSRFRGILPPIGMVDVSPILLVFVYKIAQKIVVDFLRMLGL